MAAAIKDAFGVDSTLIEGTNGIFDVVADDTTIFSKHEAGRFPEHGEVIDAVRSQVAS